MVVDPITAAVVVSAIAGGAQAIGNRMGKSKAIAKERSEAKLRTKESRRETKSGLLNDAYERKSDLNQHHRGEKKRISEKKTRGMHETADLVRKALNL